jgi:hypothetical protein
MISQEFDRKVAAARHSIEAFMLLEAARRIRDARIDLRNGGFHQMARDLEPLIAKLDRKRRALMKGKRIERSLADEKK